MINDYTNFYRRLSAPFRRHPLWIRMLKIANRFIEVVMYGAYLIMVGEMTWRGVLAGWSSVLPNLLRLILIPGSGFVLLSLVRHRLNVPRPYEKWPIKPLIAREKTGDSFPSRHVFSATVIAMAAFWLSWQWGVLLLVLMILLAAIRVIGGVHYPRDVIVGAICGLLVGGLLFL